MFSHRRHYPLIHCSSYEPNDKHADNRRKVRVKSDAVNESDSKISTQYKKSSMRKLSSQMKIQCLELNDSINAFLYNSHNEQIIISRSGHPTMHRSYDKRDYKYGGWIDLKRECIIFHCGTAGQIPKALRDKVQASIENHFRKYLRRI